MRCTRICIRSDMGVGHCTSRFTSKKPSLTWVIGQSGRWGLAITNVSRLPGNTDIIDCSNTGSTVVTFSREDSYLANTTETGMAAQMILDATGGTAHVFLGFT